MNKYHEMYHLIRNYMGLDQPEDEEEFRETLKDILKGGADSGFCSFTYTGDIVKFYDNNEINIEEIGYQLCTEFGYKNNFEMCNTFKRSDVLNIGIDGYKTLMVWLALEETAKYYVDHKNEFDSIEEEEEDEGES